MSRFICHSNIAGSFILGQLYTDHLSWKMIFRNFCSLKVCRIETRQRNCIYIGFFSFPNLLIYFTILTCSPNQISIPFDRTTLSFFLYTNGSWHGPIDQLKNHNFCPLLLQEYYMKRRETNGERSWTPSIFKPQPDAAKSEGQTWREKVDFFLISSHLLILWKTQHNLNGSSSFFFTSPSPICCQ